MKTLDSGASWLVNTLVMCWEGDTSDSMGKDMAAPNLGPSHTLPLEVAFIISSNAKYSTFLSSENHSSKVSNMKESENPVFVASLSVWMAWGPLRL